MTIRDLEHGYNGEIPSSRDSFDEELDNIELTDLGNNTKNRNHLHNSSNHGNGGHIRLGGSPRPIYSDNKFIKFWQKVWYGPEYPSDDPPSFNSAFEQYPKIFRHRYSHKTRLLLLIGYCFLWFVLIYSILNPNLTSPPTIKGKRQSIISLSCNGQEYFWKGKNAKCGLNGELCAPFEDREAIVRCPALCDRGGWTYSSTPVGDRMVKYTGYTIGGGYKQPENGDDTLTYPYRADSFTCGSAVHAGILSPFFGGCVKVSFVGSQLNFNSTMGNYGTDFSVPFPSFFPSSYVFKMLPEGISGCYDPRILILFANILLGLPIVYLADGLATFWIVNLVGYWTLLLSLDPPLIVDPEDPSSVHELFSVGFQRMLPMCFVLYTLWKSAAKRTFSEPSSPLAKVCLWYPLFWLGLCNSITFDRLPVDRLTPQDLKEQPGGLIAVLSIVSTILVCAVIQAYKLWKSGRFQKYFKIYITFILGVFTLAMLPGLSLRIHHYILALLLIPGCATKGLTAYMFQGILLGLFLSGVAKWDFASILETQRSLLRDEAGGNLAPPAFSKNIENGIVSWIDHNSTSSLLANGQSIPPKDQLLGYSLLINDIERYVGNETMIDLSNLIGDNKSLKELVDKSLEDNTDENGDITLFLRLAKSTLSHSGGRRGDYTRAGTLKWPSGNWTAPPEGLS
ncbi:putative membrane protein [Wickerhamomyces ciferrii]|uniref:Membrane protein n=1 Tax=Wickerhamomyces ciferrii (strain ATCC 14091 / BCRC 22168 / CBS 111 / JCM 3599 / NBRC 0793 / NRRL Y-1031 F-60-10) TaxID=1206466 RepID=K0KL90_WICCF|nr:uncharacterized protein BN7_3305 [Wickerhamomyces ciferrii]CCH43751.1 putative membrane protein [Wickerhamomyces ciferrii]